jgi:hypothetical protein
MVRAPVLMNRFGNRMKNVKSWSSRIRGLVRAALLTVVCLSALKSVAAAEQTLPLLKTKTAIYTNAIVTTKAKNYIFILHSTGMANLKIQDLSPEAQQELGYARAEDKPKPSGLVFAKQLMPALESKFKPYQERLRKQLPWTEQQLTPTRNVIYIALGVFLAGYLFFSYCCHLICIKSKKDTSVLVWLPVFKLIPLLRAADMSAWWFLASFLPVINLIVPILWAFNIVKVRGKGALLAVFLLLPITNLFAFLYLAFSEEASTETVPRYKSMSLQTA